jgi:hypothetical protein
MSLDVCAELELAVFGIIQTGANNNSPRAKGIRDAVMGGETIQPKRAVGDHFNDQLGGKALERESIVNAPSALFKGANVTFHLGNMFIVRYRVERHLEISDIATERFKLAVHQNGSDNKAARLINM